jgi:hypothetical protein
MQYRPGIIVVNLTHILPFVTVDVRLVMKMLGDEAEEFLCVMLVIAAKNGRFRSPSACFIPAMDVFRILLLKVSLVK